MTTTENETATEETDRQGGETDPDKGTRDLWVRRLKGWPEPSATLRIMARSLGALQAGWTKIEPEHYRSRTPAMSPSLWQVTSRHRSALVFLVPGGTAEQTSESNTGDAAHPTARLIAEVIRESGADAHPHAHGEAAFVLPYLAADASLGAIGRNGLLVSPKHGCRFHIGAVSTDLEAEPSLPIAGGIPAFCSSCTRCVGACPADAVDRDPTGSDSSRAPWQRLALRCRTHLEQSPEGCTACLEACPFGTGFAPSRRLLDLVAPHPSLMRILGRLYARR